MYYGFGMFNLHIDSLGSIIYFLWRHWNMDTPMDTPTEKMLKKALEAQLMNVGLEGNIPERDFSCLGDLAEDFWFKKNRNYAIGLRYH